MRSWNGWKALKTDNITIDSGTISIQQTGNGTISINESSDVEITVGPNCPMGITVEEADDVTLNAPSATTLSIDVEGDVEGDIAVIPREKADISIECNGDIQGDTSEEDE